MLADNRHVEQTPRSDRANGDRYADQRAAPRHGLMLRQARLSCDEGQFLCLVRDVSETGISIRCFHPLPASQARFTIELNEGDPLPMQKMWETEGLAGFQFDERVGLDRLLKRKAPLPERRIRIALDAPALIVVRGVSVNARITDLSQQGAGVVAPGEWARDQLVRFGFAGFPTAYAKIRWRRGDHIGVVFEQHLPLRDFACLIAQLQNVG